MSFWWNQRDKSNQPSSSPQPNERPNPQPDPQSIAPRIDEIEALKRESDTPPEHWTHEAGKLLDRVYQRFPSHHQVIVEVMLPTGDGTQLISEDVRPVTAPLLFARIRAGQSLCWQAFKTRQPQVYQQAPDEATERATGAAASRSAPTRLVSSRVALSVPLVWNGAVVGLLNLESRVAESLSPGTISLLEQDGLLGELARELAEIKRKTISDAEVAELIIQKMQDRIGFTISPDDTSEAYYQLLSVAASVVKPTNVSAGLILIYNRKQELAIHADGGTRYAVRAARFGAFNSALEWELKGQSIARRIIENKKGEVILDAQKDDDYRDSGTKQTRTGELIVPLIASGDDSAAGVIGLVTDYDDNFDGANDLAHVNRVADIATYAIQRSEKYKLDRRRAEQQRCADQLQALLGQLFPRNMRAVTDDLIKQVRDEVSNRILNWALDFTKSQHGAFVLIQSTPEPDGSFTDELVMTDKLTPPDSINEQEFPLDRFPRWAPDKGYSGQAFQKGETLNITNVYTGEGSEIKPEHYIPYFLKAMSEVATPLVIGATTLGVLDIEADEVDHYTTDYVDWIEFLARQAAFALSVIDRVVKTRVELKIADLSGKVDEAITKIRSETLATLGVPAMERVRRIRDTRQETLDMMIAAMRDLTGAWVGRFLVELNAYRSDDTIDTERGRLYYLASSDPNETTNENDRFFDFGKGVSSVTFESAARAAERNEKAVPIVFNSEEKRHPQYFDSNPDRKSLSGIFQPVFEGTRVTGVLNLECEKEGVFSPELIQACETAGNLISKLMTGSRLRVDVILREMLRDFDFEIIRLQSSNLLAYMDLALRRAAQLTLVTEGKGWGALFLLRPSPTGTLPSIERLYWHDFTDPNSVTTVQEFDRTAIEYPIFREAIRTRLPVVILDRMQQPDEERRAETWPSAARAIIVIPLLSPRQTGEGSDVIGLLALANPEPAQYSDHDKFSLGLFAESIVYGLKTIALMQARAQLMEQLRFFMGRATTPASLYADDALTTLRDAEQSTTIGDARSHLGEIGKAIGETTELIGLTQNITTWFLDLADDELQPDLSDTLDQTARSILTGFQKPANAFAGLYSRTLQWDDPVAPAIPITGGEEAARLIGASLAQYLESVVSDENVQTIAVRAEQHERTVVFSVRYDGPTVPREDRDRIFSIGVTTGSPNAQDTSIGSRQQGLYQVRRIADRLGWKADYKDYPSQPLPNSLYLEIPLA